MGDGANSVLKYKPAPSHTELGRRVKTKRGGDPKITASPGESIRCLERKVVVRAERSTVTGTLFDWLRRALSRLRLFKVAAVASAFARA